MMKLSIGQFLAARGISVGKPSGSELGSLLAFVDRPLWIQMVKNRGCVCRMWPLRRMGLYLGSATTGSSSVQVRIGLSGFRSCFAEVAQRPHTEDAPRVLQHLYPQGPVDE